MGNKNYKTKLRYRGSRDGWMHEDFHRMSDGLGPTVTLMKIKDNEQCIGGFTSAQWVSPEIGTYATDTTAILFNLTTGKFFKSVYHNRAIECNTALGPGFGYSELIAQYEPFNKDRACRSRAYQNGYSIDMDKEYINKLTNLERTFGDVECKFTISELEVWEVIFEE